MESMVDMVSDITDVTTGSESPQAVYHYHQLGEQLEVAAVDFEANNQYEELNTQVINNLQGSLYNSLSSIENSVNLDISLSNTDKQSLLNVLLLLKTTITSTNFGTAIINFANSLDVENIFDTISYSSFAARGFFSGLFKAIVGAVVVVATSVVGYVLGSAFGFAGGIIGAASGFYWGLEAVEALFDIQLVNHTLPNNKLNYITI